MVCRVSPSPSIHLVRWPYRCSLAYVFMKIVVCRNGWLQYMTITPKISIIIRDLWFDLPQYVPEMERDTAADTVKTPPWVYSGHCVLFVTIAFSAYFGHKLVSTDKSREPYREEAVKRDQFERTNYPRTFSKNCRNKGIKINLQLEIKPENRLSVHGYRPTCV